MPNSNLAIILTAWLLAAPAAHATTFSVAQFGQGAGTNCTFNEASFSPLTIAIGSAECSGMDVVAPIQYRGSFAARADFDGLGAYARYVEVALGDVIRTPVAAGAQAQIQDEIVVTSGVGNGTLQLPITVSGTTTALGFATRSVGELSGRFRLPNGDIVGLVEGPGTYIWESEFQDGIALPFGLQLFATISGIVHDGSGGQRGGLADFFSSAIFGLFTVLDSNGNPISGATVFSTSGHQYNVSSNAIPVPAAWVLMLAGIAGIRMAARRR